MRVQVEGYGTFDINEEKLPALLAFLSEAQGVRVQESNTVRERNDNGFTGRQLLSEG
jgi:hypothetical protein